jgi:hypothetical protein
MKSGFVYLVAIIDWYSRYVLGWRLSNSLESSFCREVLEEALSQRRPEICNTDQGVQFTSRTFTIRLEAAGVKISMDGKGRALDKVFIKRLWWSVKYEHVYLHSHPTVRSLHQGLTEYLEYFTCKRPHQGLDYQTPWDVYRGAVKVGMAASADVGCEKGRSRVSAATTLRLAALDCATSRYSPMGRTGLQPVHLRTSRLWSRQWGPPQGGVGRSATKAIRGGRTRHV